MRKLILLMAGLAQLAACRSDELAMTKMAVEFMGVLPKKHGEWKKQEPWQPEEIPGFSDKRVCEIAAPRSDNSWSVVETRADAVTEAEKRGLTPPGCWALILQDYPEGYLCALAVEEGEWSARPGRRHYVSELKSREKAPQDCTQHI